MLPQKIVMTLKKISASKYYDIVEIHTIEIPHKKKIVIPIPYELMFS